MTRKTLRNGILLAVAAVSASIEAPRLAHQPIEIATAVLAPASAIDHAVEQVSENVTRSHLGFDTNIYPGDKAMNAWRNDGQYEWVGYYLEAPCHKDASWSGKRSRLVGSDWGLAVIYVGQQTWGHLGPAAPHTASSKKSKGSKKGHVRRMARKSARPVAAAGATCSAAFVNTARGRVDAADAIAKATHEGFAPGTIIFLDVEFMEVTPPPMRDYYRAWTRAVLADGQFRPGIYAHTRNAARVYDDISDVYTQAGIDDDPPFWIAGSGGFSTESLPEQVGHAFASAWQAALDVVRTHNGFRLPIDISVSKAASPSRAVK